MKRFKRLVRHLPRTKRFSLNSFRRFMTKYKRIIAKPTTGSRGRGVIQVSALGNRRYELHVEKRKKKLCGVHNTYRYLKRLTASRHYIVQRWIPRADISGRPFDLRVIIQRKKHSRIWRVTAKAAKVAGRGYIVSNITRSKGTLLSATAAIKRSSLKYHSPKTLMRKVNRVALLSAKRLRKLYPRHRIYGLDVGLDRVGRVWIFEANLYPSMSHFRKLRKKTLYRRIMAYRRG